MLSGCKAALLNPKGMIAADEKHIMLTSVWLMLIVVIPVFILTFAFCWRYRASNTKATYSPNWSHSTTLEIIWWSIPCVIIAILGVITWVSSYRLDPYKSLATNGAKPVVIQAISLEWKWLFIYPDEHVATVNYVNIPVGVPVQFLITAEGPMNSIQIPQLAGQIYAMAGMQTKLNLIADAPGDYRGMAANFTGEGFSDMNFIVHAGTPDEFHQWVKTAQASPSKLTMAEYDRLVKPSQRNVVQYYSSAGKEIFEASIMKYMMPMHDMKSPDEKETILADEKNNKGAHNHAG
ncbi:MAG: ubiquinol oxidase subunit II [Gammaproteobacteria bacterium]